MRVRARVLPATARRNLYIRFRACVRTSRRSVGRSLRAARCFFVFPLARDRREFPATEIAPSPSLTRACFVPIVGRSAGNIGRLGSAEIKSSASPLTRSRDIYPFEHRASSPNPSPLPTNPSIGFYNFSPRDRKKTRCFRARRTR